MRPSRLLSRAWSSLASVYQPGTVIPYNGKMFWLCYGGGEREVGEGDSINASKTYFMSILSYSPQAQANTDKILIDRNLTGGGEERMLYLWRNLTPSSASSSQPDCGNPGWKFKLLFSLDSFLLSPTPAPPVTSPSSYLALASPQRSFVFLALPHFLTPNIITNSNQSKAWLT